MGRSTHYKLLWIVLFNVTPLKMFDNVSYAKSTFVSDLYNVSNYGFMNVKKMLLQLCDCK